MATIYLMNREQRHCCQRFIDDVFNNNPDLETTAFCLALMMFVRDIGIEPIEDINSTAADDLRELLRIFGYGLADKKVIKLEQ